MRLTDGCVAAAADHIVVRPTRPFDKPWIYTPEVRAAAERQALVARDAALGYDVSRREFPEF